MPKIIFEDFDIPTICDECEYIGHYEDGAWSRHPHCCCELIWQLTREDYKVDKDHLDENCPLKIGYIEF